MKIGIDVRCLAEGRRTGVEEYTLDLLKNLFEIDPKNRYVLFLNSYGREKSDLEWTKKYKNVSIKKFSYPNKLLNFLFWYFRWPKIDEMIGGADIVFFPNIFFGAVSRKTKMLLTMHDLSFERYPETFSWKRRLWHIFINPKKLCQRADKLIAVSDSTNRDIASLYGIEREKIETIHSGIGEKFSVIDRNKAELIKVKEKYDLPYKFILYFGTIEPRKNLIGIIRGFNKLREEALKNDDEEFLRYSLVISGQKGWLSGKIHAEINDSKFKEKIIIISSIPEEEKEHMFNLASLFVYPSFFEGFGFPPLEAMGCGVPAVVSNNSSLPEIAGDSAIMVDPDKPDEIRAAIKEILSSGELYNNLKERGIKKAGEFRWKRTAQKFLKALNSLSNE